MSKISARPEFYPSLVFLTDCTDTRVQISLFNYGTQRSNLSLNKKHLLTMAILFGRLCLQALLYMKIPLSLNFSNSY